MTEKSKPRVLMLTSTLPRWEGDSEPRFVLDLAKHLSADFDIELLAPHAPGAGRKEVLEGVPVTRFRYWIPRWQSVAYEGGISWRLKENRWRLVPVPFFMFSMGWHVVRRLWRKPVIQLIHAHWLVPQGIVAIAARLFARPRVPVVTTSHGGDLFGLRGRFWRSMNSFVLRNSDAVTVVSRVMAEAARVLASGVEPVVAPMGTDLTERFVPLPESERRPVGELVFVGRLVEKKGVHYLLEALAIVKREYPNARLKIIGHGPLRKSLEADTVRLGLQEDVQFLGPVPHAQLPSHYQAADIAVFPFVEAASGDQEGFGLVLVEAMGCGCAVIASALPAVKDVIDDGQTGLLVPSRDPGALASAVTALLEDEQSTRELGERARAIALIKFDWSVCQARFGSEFRRLIRPTD